MTTITTEPNPVSATGPHGPTARPEISAAAEPVAATDAPVAAASGTGSTTGLAGWLDTADDTDTEPATPVKEGPQGSSRLRFWLGLGSPSSYLGGPCKSLRRTREPTPTGPPRAHPPQTVKCPLCCGN